MKTKRYYSAFIAMILLYAISQLPDPTSFNAMHNVQSWEQLQ